LSLDPRVRLWPFMRRAEEARLRVAPCRLSYYLGAKDQSTRYRYCPILSLPTSFKDARETVPDTRSFE
jgi:hypothetical protein